MYTHYFGDFIESCGSSVGNGLQAGWAEEARDISQFSSILVWSQNFNISAKESLGYFELKKHKPWFDEI
jgi:hypothetical protein